jgi:hypothetical protein
MAQRIVFAAAPSNVHADYASLPSFALGWRSYRCCVSNGVLAASIYFWCVLNEDRPGQAFLASPTISQSRDVNAHRLFQHAYSRFKLCYWVAINTRERSPCPQSITYAFSSVTMDSVCLETIKTPQ